MSAGHVEREIQSLLLEGNTPKAIAQTLVERWRSNLLEPREQDTLTSFLLATGQREILLNELIRLLQANLRVPWKHFAALTLQAGITWSAEQVKALKDGMQEQNLVHEFCEWPGADDIDRGFRRTRLLLESEKLERLAKEKANLRDQLQFFRSQRMHEDEAVALKKLQGLFPDDTEFKVSEADLAERWAREVIASYPGQKQIRGDEDFLERAQATQPELKNAKDLLASQSEQLARQNPQIAYDLSVMFMFMESYSEALKMLAYAVPSAESLWLRLELLLKAREFVLALDEADRLEETFSADPESTFAATYARARALRGLGQTAQAVELIRSIVSIRPNYKSARSLLMDWGGEA